MQKVLNESQHNHYRANTVHLPFIIMNHLTVLKKTSSVNGARKLLSRFFFLLL